MHVPLSGGQMAPVTVLAPNETAHRWPQFLPDGKHFLYLRSSADPAKAGVYIGFHPDDPPVYPLGGVPRPVFGTMAGFKRALEIADSPNIGMCLCVGCWLEGGPLMGKDPVETIKYFGGKKKLFKVHFRNVSAPLPHFTEAMLDDGYYDMIKVMKALVAVNFEGIAIPDHIPNFGGPPAGAQAAAGGARGGGAGGFRANPGLAYLLGGMNAMLKAAQSKG